MGTSVMESRRAFLGLAASLLPAGLAAQAAPQDPAPLGVIAKHALTGPFEGYEVVLTRSAKE